MRIFIKMLLVMLRCMCCCVLVVVRSVLCLV